MQEFDGSVQFIGGCRLFDPIASRVALVGPADKVGSDHLRDTASSAASVLNVKITGIFFVR
jgi:hypothetical protein